MGRKKTGIATGVFLLVVACLAFFGTTTLYDFLFPKWPGQSVTLSIAREQTFVMKSDRKATTCVDIYIEGDINGSAQLIFDHQTQTLNLPEDMNKRILRDFYADELEVRYIPGPGVSGSAVFHCDFY